MPNVTRISDTQKRLQGRGSARYVKHNPPARPIGRLWATPKEFTNRAREFYQLVGGQLVESRVLSDLDKFAFIELAQVYGQLDELRQILGRDGYVLQETVSNAGAVQTRRHPAQAMYRELLGVFIKLCEKFGLSPGDRKRLDIEIDSNPSDPDREFLGL